MAGDKYKTSVVANRDAAWPRGYTKHARLTPGGKGDNLNPKQRPFVFLDGLPAQSESIEKSMLYKPARTTKVLRKRVRTNAIHTHSQDVSNRPAIPGVQGKGSLQGLEAGACQCLCQRNRLLSLLPLCRLIPTQTFGSSYFTTPTITVLRTLFPAWSYSYSCPHARSRRPKGRAGMDLLSTTPSVAAKKGSGEGSSSMFAPNATEQGPFGHLPQRLSTQDFLSEVASSDMYSQHRVISVTWVKALASHMSHEFLQFVVEDTRTGRRDRLLSDRQETGDWIIIPEPTTSTPSKVPWQQMTPYKRRHSLPLPLVSLTFDRPTTRPTLRQMAELMFEISSQTPVYSAMREMCWWFAEAVVETAQERFGHAVVKEWKWAKWRYSFILCNNWIRRRRLEGDAEEFEKSCAREMVF